MSRSGETRLGLTDSQSAQTHPLECTLHYDDDDSYDCNDDNGHPQKNSPKYVRKEVLVGTIGARFEPPGEPEVRFWVSRSAQTRPLVCSVDDDRILVMTAIMKTVIFKRNLRRKSERSSCFERMSVRCDTLESPKWVSHA